MSSIGPAYINKFWPDDRSLWNTINERMYPQNDYNRLLTIKKVWIKPLQSNVGGTVPIRLTGLTAGVSWIVKISQWASINLPATPFHGKSAYSCSKWPPSLSWREQESRSCTPGFGVLARYRYHRSQFTADASDGLVRCHRHCSAVVWLKPSWSSTSCCNWKVRFADTSSRLWCSTGIGRRAKIYLCTRVLSKTFSKCTD